MKVLVTGSRGWHDRERIREDLREYRDEAAASGDGLVVIHGDCPQGADKIAKYWCRRLNIEDIPMPADWSKYGRSAGPRRNQQMLDQHHPDVVLAYRATGKSSGTDDMVNRAHAAHVRVVMRDAREASTRHA